MYVDQFRYLGVLIASDLSWNAHVNFIVQKSMQKLWFLRRNICHCTPETKLTAYRTILRPMFEYSDIVWDPYTKLLIDKLETKQKALRFVYNRYGFISSISELCLVRSTRVCNTSKNRSTRFFTMWFMVTCVCVLAVIQH